MMKLRCFLSFLILNLLIICINSQADYGIYWNGLTKLYMTSICPIGNKTTSFQFGYHGYQFEPNMLSRNLNGYYYNDSIHCFINIQGPNVWDQYQNETQYLDVFFPYLKFGINNCSLSYIKVYRSASCTFGTSDLTLLSTYCGTSMFTHSQLDNDPIASRCVQIEIFLANITNWINVTALSTNVSPYGTVLYCDYSLTNIYQNVSNSCFYNLQNDNTMDFTIDVASYYNGNCNWTYIYSKYQFQCAPPSTTFRCLHAGFRCNGYLIRGCKDYAANYVYEPSFCFSTMQTTLDLLPLWIILGILGGLLASYILYWLLWRTGWLVWHLGRLRHYKIITCCCKMSLCVKCNSCCKGRGNGFGGCGKCRPCCKSIKNSNGCCAKICSCCETCCSGKVGPIGNNIDSTTGFPKTPSFKSPPIISETQFINKSNNFDGNWLNFFQGDGGHLRELRF